MDASTGASKGNHTRRRRLRITEGSQSHVIPLSVVAKHLKGISANTEIGLEISGHTLRDLRVLLHVLDGKKQTVSLPVSKLVQEAEARKHSASAAQPGRVLARFESKDHKKGDKADVAPLPVGTGNKKVQQV